MRHDFSVVFSFPNLLFCNLNFTLLQCRAELITRFGFFLHKHIHCTSVLESSNLGIKSIARGLVVVSHYTVSASMIPSRPRSHLKLSFLSYPPPDVYVCTLMTNPFSSRMFGTGDTSTLYLLRPLGPLKLLSSFFVRTEKEKYRLDRHPPL